ncbi:MAG: NAD(P)/FAD-dependent oxidoreductase [Intrasporangiaceae bacterium]|nr:NAD(P)/FAD-dependent oxidoreductase [Intrasporangiaceae bacterium]
MTSQIHDTDPIAQSDSTPRHRVVVIGSGFGGLFFTRALRRADVDITLVARTSHHLFQPLLYQVATGILSQGQIAPATREILAGQRNARVVLGEVTSIDVAARTLTSEFLDQQVTLPYDTLLVAAGAGQSYFGNDHFARHAPGMKTIDDALELRGRIFGAFEAAEIAATEEERRRLLTFIVVGAGPTGVEMAGQIAELANRTLRHDFRSIDPRSARIILVDAAPAVLPTFGDKLGGRARDRLESMGVDVMLDTMVTDVDNASVTVRDADGREHRIDAATKVWAAGVSASSLAGQLAEQTGAELDRAGRIAVAPDLTVPGHPEIFVVGDMAALNDYPGVAQVAIQGARYAAAQLRRRLAGKPEQEPFVYRDKGSMATISRFSAVASIGRSQFGGFIAWLLWLAVHLVYIIGFKKRVTTIIHWAVSFLGRGRSERTSTEQQVFARTAIEDLGEGYHPRVPR